MTEVVVVLEGDDSQGGRTRYNAYLADRVVSDTIGEARRMLLKVFEQMRADSGIETIR